MTAAIIGALFNAQDLRRQREATVLEDANAAIATAVEQDRDDRHADAAVNAQKGRYEAWIAIEGENP